MIEVLKDFKVNYEQMLDDYDYIIQKAFGSTEWDESVITRGTGIHLRGDDFLDTTNFINEAGGNYRTLTKEEVKVFIDKHLEKYSFWNKNCPEYTRNTIDALSEHLKFPIHRARYLRMQPGMGLPIHNDADVRYHFVIHTNPKAFFATTDTIEDLTNLKYEHMPVINHFYRVDTTKPHFVFNAGTSPRIHLVIS